MPLYLRDRDTTIHVLAAVTDGDVLRARASDPNGFTVDPNGFTVRFLEAFRREAVDSRNLLPILDRLVHLLDRIARGERPFPPGDGEGWVEPAESGS